MTRLEARDLARYARERLPGTAARKPPKWRRDRRPELDSHQRRKCYLCGHGMIVLATKDGSRYFWSCPGFPGCKGSARIDQARFAAYAARPA